MRPGVGRIRRKLAAMLEAAVPEIVVKPEDLFSLPPKQPVRGMARWNGYGRLKEHPNVSVSLCSWDRMGDIVRQGVDVSQDSPTSYEFHRKGP